MSTTIFYFSATGNSLEVARDIGKELGGAEIISIPKLMAQDIIAPQAERIGIVYPVYMFGMPLIVRRFIRKLKAAPSQYIFAVATYGGQAGNPLAQTDRELRNRGAKLSVGFLVKMPGNYTPLYGAMPFDKQGDLFRAESERVKMIAGTVMAGARLPFEAGSWLNTLVFSKLIYSLASPHIPKMDKSFWADNKCNSCGICQKVCPVNNITIENGRPRWHRHCEQCMACLQWCPQCAIQSGKNTSGRARYHHPHVRLGDFV